MKRFRLNSVALSSAAAAFVALTVTTTVTAQTLPNGVAAGETTRDSATLWTRSTAPGQVNFEYATDPGFTNIVGSSSATVTDPTLPVKAHINGLNPGVSYYYRATDAAGTSASGKFRTASAAGARDGFRFGVSGDWRGELAPYPAIKNAAGRNLDQWVSLGDTIYADFASPDVPVAQATTLAQFRAKNNEVYAERFGVNTFRDLRASTGFTVTIDDHEVTNDFQGGAHPSSDPRFAGDPGNFVNETQLYRNGLQAFQEYNPVRERVWTGTGDPRFDNKPNLYRGQEFGANAAMFTLDARSFRDQGLPAANPLDPVSVGNFLVQSFNPSRTMLGRPQLDQLKSDLLAAQQNGVTWKFVNVPEPIQNLGVLNASDRFEGYAAERTEILKFIDDNNIENVVFIAADIHGTLVNDLTYQNGPGQPQIHSGAFEVTTGSVAFDAPFGPTVAGIAAGLGLPGALTPAQYAALPAAVKEAYIQGLINAQIQPLGYNPIGLQDSPIMATLVEGGYSATNSFGWTEFEIAPITQELCVTTWGIDAYTQAQLNANPASIIARDPRVVSKFCVLPVPEPTSLSLLVLGALAVIRRR